MAKTTTAAGNGSTAGDVVARMTSLPHSTPADQGVDARGIQSFLDAVEQAPALQPHSLIVLRHGQVVASGSWAPYRTDRPYMLYSMSKSFTATALGFAVDEGLLRLDDRVAEFFPEISLDDPGTRSMRVRDLAAMSTGHLSDRWRTAFEADPAEPVRGFLRLPPDRDPGTVFAYNQPATYTLAAILQRITGITLVDYLRPRLFDPLGIDDATWQEYPPGRNVGFVGLFVPPEAIARFGQLYLGRGMWDGRQILPEYWVSEATRPQVGTAGEPHPDWQQGYGFQFWMSRHGYRGDGAYGQFCLVLPDQNAVVAYTGATLEMQSVLDLAWQHLLPAFDGKVSRTADTELARRLETLALPTVSAAPGPTGYSQSFAPAGGRCAAQPSLTGIEVPPDEPGIVLREAESALRLRFGRGSWAVSGPIAASGGWVGTATLRFDVIFLETPHRLHITCDRSTGTFDASWATPPLQPLTLHELHAPRNPLGTAGPAASVP